MLRLLAVSIAELIVSVAMVSYAIEIYVLGTEAMPGVALDFMYEPLAAINFLAFLLVMLFLVNESPQ